MGAVSGRGVSDLDPNAQSVGYGLIASLLDANLASTADQAMVMTPATKYVVERIVFEWVSGTVALAAGSIYTAASKGGNALLTAYTTFLNLTGAGAFQDFVQGDLASGQGTTVQTSGQLYLSLTTANGGAATANIYVYGHVIA